MEEQPGYVPTLIEWRVREVEAQLKQVDLKIDQILLHERNREKEQQEHEAEQRKDRSDFFWKSIIGPAIIGLILVIAQHYWKPS
jgi:hypothetical protein